MHALHSTYDSPLLFAKAPACPTLRRISRQQLQEQDNMFFREQSTIERSCSRASRASLSAHKRSVPGMKSLLPLKLLSPTLPEFDTWPSLEPSKRTTFGIRIVSQDSGEFSEIGDRARDSLVYRKRSQQYRDTPIYNQPGSPIPSRAYFSDDDVCFNHSQPGSISDEYGIIQDFVNMQEEDIEDDGHYQNVGEETPCTVKNFPQREVLTPTPRWSDLSFQCSGEALFENEAAWLRSPMSKKRSADNRISTADARDGNLADRLVESWLSDTSSSFEHEDEVLACATALSPSKAQVIDLRINANRQSKFSLRIPARSSSLMGTSGPENNFWEALGTPPITPAGPSDRDPDRSLSLDCPNNLQLPKRRLDRSMPSPPLSPNSSPPQNRYTRVLSTQDFDDQLPLPPSSLPRPMLPDIISSLETLMSSFPSTILLPEHPCITAIRSRNATLPPPIRQNTTSPPPLKSPFGHEFPRPPSHQLTGKPKQRSFSPYRRESSLASLSSRSSTHPAQTALSSSLPKPFPSTALHPPDLSPLRRIFPHTSDIMLSSLYAHILAHIFISSLALSPPTSPLPQYSRSSGRRRDTPYWSHSPLSPKAANVLGIPMMDEENVDKQLHFRLRIQALQQNLRKCIYCLISVMDENLGIEEMAEFDDSGPGFNNGKLFMRTLEEVVRGCEARNADGML